MFGSLASWSLLGSRFVLPYEVGEEQLVPNSDGKGIWTRWQQYKCIRIEDKKPFSIFQFSAQENQALELEVARNAVKRLRMTKHPGIPAFEWTGERHEKGIIQINLVTEPLTPLATVLAELDLNVVQREMFLSMGIRDISQAVAFLNDQCKLIHGNVCMSTVLVTKSLDWKLGYLDMLSEHSNVHGSLLVRYGHVVGDQYKPGELQKADMSAVSSAPPGAIDSWGMGCFIQECFSDVPLTDITQLRNTGVIPKELLAEYQKLLNQNPARRLNASKLADSQYLKNDLVDTMHFLQSLSIKESNEKEHFFRTLPKLIPTFPAAICTRKLLPLISSALEYGGAPAMALGCLLQVGKMLEPDEFTSEVIPIISSLFSSQDRSIRRSLIDSMGEYASSLTEAVVEQSIYPQLTKGLAEPNAFLREQTLKAMLPLAPKLSQRTLNTSLLKHLAKLQVDEEPSIRANTTVLLGNIAHLLGDAACKRILLNAFTRALKDVFAPSRIAALKALMATAQYHTHEAVANRVVPSVAPMTLDPNTEVRKGACQALAYYVKQLSKAAEDLDNGVDISKTASSLGTPADLSSNVSAYVGWAMTTIAAAAGAGVTNVQNSRPEPAATRPSNSVGTTPKQSALPPQPPVSVHTTAKVQPLAKPSTASDGWGDMDDAFGEDLDLPQPSTAPPKAVTKVDSSLGGNMAKVSTGDGWDDNDGWDESSPIKVAPRVVPPAEPKIRKKPMKLGVVRKSTSKGD